ncbi:MULTISPECIES: 1-phosphofructokinase [unclassified Paenibacillus]|uniref:1-phosphofructokinase n=1 Tax=unclassified Paenibacillus TaxID=185978 RepID=UPI00240581AB|nr:MULTISPECIES: 1-phosphofructokinase [unclassified Paenibacillus]MDF9840568.1 1-phosphofructokinase [Paenibacillus sp. PastF-2]MDF9847150.1 1-phosphofructokinase [Paenibacillus sp. PastM-2]MDF9853722.1 1-phosphofructokinase [Paenibacillus sp. PastF-1]MDH6478792.1 1-phosphofructokinase [Paenibacillus sp. PastH-2]MDH6506524.1 1-phosphofructokinase [Paenibacillus sp. PastM-3]
MIYTVTLNPSIDYIVEVEDMKLGSLNRMSRDLKLPGGKGINVSRVLNQLKVDNTATGFLGGFTGRFIEDWLREEGTASSFVPVGGDTRINIKLKSGEETEINGTGPEITAAEAESLMNKLRNLQAGDIVVMSGSIPPSLGGDFYNRLIGVCKQQDAQFVIDTTGQALQQALEHSPLLVKPNHHELAELFGVTISTREEIIMYGRKLLEAGAQHVLVSMAGEGALLITEQGVYAASAPAGQVRNSVGAGDSMIAGFVGTLSREGDVLEAFRTGVASGSATAFSDDLADGGFISRLRPQIQITQL